MKSLASILVFLSLVAQLLGQKEPGAPGDAVIVTVDGTPILESQVADAVDRAYGHRLAQFPPEQAETMARQIRQGVINEMIGKVLLVNSAKRGGLKVSDKELNEGMAEVADKNMPGASIEQFIKEADITRERLRKDVMESVLIMKLADREMDRVQQPTPEEIMAYYEENKDRMRSPESVRARHILIRTNANDDSTKLEAKRKVAEGIREELLDNPTVDFAEIAIKKSEGPSGPHGGDLGLFERGKMIPEFEEAAFSQKVGEIGGVVKTQFGFHIIKVEEHLQAKDYALEEVAPQVLRRLVEQRQAERMKELVDELRAAAEIVRPGAATPAKS